MQQPSFWKNKSLLSFLFLPLSFIYYAITLIRNVIAKPLRPKIPVICIGNATVGGAGKTPTAIAIAQLLIDMKKKPVFLSRGYNGSLNVTTFVNPDIHTAKECGDEPLLLCKVAPTIISKKRQSGAKLAMERGFDVIIMDDGLQNPSLEKTLSLLVIDGTFGIGNGFIMPAGPLRESLKSALKKTESVIFIGEDKTFLIPRFLKNENIIKATIKAKDNKAPSGKYVAFSGLGNNDKFFKTLDDNGYNVVQKIPYDDHYQYTKKDIDDLNNLATSWKAKLITTEKDFSRLSDEQQSGIETLPISIEFANEKEIKDILGKI
jgi:tetraacyldisaccharide 4'-kinase